MKFKFPKTITIGETIFHIEYDYKKENGASFQYALNGEKAFFKFGMLNHKNNPLEFFSMLIHELKEVIQIEQGTRFRRNANSDSCMFVYNHKEHTDMCCRLTSLLEQFIK